MTDQRPPAAVELSLFAVTGAAVLSWFRLFTGTSWIAPLLAVAACGHLVAAAARRARLAVAVSALASLVASTFVYCWVAVPATTVAGIPGAGTFTTLAHQLDAAQTAFRATQAPTTALGGFVLALAVLVWAVTVASDWLAFRLDARAEALVPAAGLFLIGTILGGTGRRTAAVLVFAPAVLLFVLLHRNSRVRPVVNRLAVAGGSRRLLGTGSVLAAAAVVLGTVAAGALPGANRHTLLDWRSDDGGTPRVTLSPLVDIRSHLTDGADALLFVVRADQPAYWRLSTLDQFNGEVWGSNGSYGATSKHLPGTKDAYGGHTTQLAQSYSITALSQVWAPAAALPASIPSSSVPLRWDASTQTLIVAADGATTDGATYEVVSEVPALTPAVLEAATAAPPADLAQQETALPADFPESVRQLAVRVTAGAATPYAKALALQRYFRDNPHFRYTTSPNLGESTNAILAFLDTGEGFCEQFAGTYAAMARSIGLPTRVAVGFTPGVTDPQHPGQFLVYGRQYHAWPEVYFTGLGWVPFEPTPGRGAPNEQAYTGIAPQQDTGAVNAPTTTAPAPGGAPSTAPGATAPAAPTTSSVPVAPPLQPAPAPPPGGTSPRGGHTSWWWLVLALAIVAGLATALFAVPVALWFAHRRRRARAGTPTERVAVAWLEACEAFSLVTAPPDPAETPFEFARRAGPLVQGTGAVAVSLARLATAATWAAGASGEVDEHRAAEAERLAREVERCVHQQLGRGGVLWRTMGWQLLRANRRTPPVGHSSRWNRSRIRSVVLSR